MYIHVYISNASRERERERERERDAGLKTQNNCRTVCTSRLFLDVARLANHAAVQVVRLTS